MEFSTSSTVIGDFREIRRDTRFYDDDYLYSLTPSGELRFIFEARGDVDGSPVLTPDGTLLVGSDDHFLYALR